MKTFEFKAWVHPKTSGDDYPFSIKVDAKCLENAKRMVEKWLRSRSTVIDDYKLI